MVTEQGEKRVTIVLPFNLYTRMVGNKAESMNAQVVRAVTELLERESKKAKQ